MIRKFKIDELDKVMQIWLNTNVNTHDFINSDYWQNNYEMVKSMLLDATIFVYEDNDVIKGFIGLTDNYIAGIFVDANNRSRGIGKSLLDYAKKKHNELSLLVYMKNIRATDFYLRENFVILKEKFDVNTGETELFMSWTN